MNSKNVEGASQVNNQVQSSLEAQGLFSAPPPPGITDLIHEAPSTAPMQPQKADLEDDDETKQKSVRSRVRCHRRLRRALWRLVSLPTSRSEGAIARCVHGASSFGDTRH